MPSGARQLGGNPAALAAGWDRWRRGFSPPPASPLGGETPGAVKVELYIAEAWVDITRLDNASPGVYYRDNIVITRGKADEAVDLDRGTCRFTLNNRDGRFSPRNPMSPYFGKIGRNTPVRVSLVQATGIRRYRFHGQVSAWPQKWDTTGTDVYVTVEASGILRQLGQGATPDHSPMYRGATRHTDHLVAYWPCEDAVGSTTIAAAWPAVSPMTINGTPTLASDATSFTAASTALPVMANASFTGYVPTYSTALNGNVVRFLMAIPAAGATNGQIICSVYMTGTIPRWELYYGTGGGLGLRGFDATDVNVADTTAVAFAVNGAPCRVSIELLQTGSTASYTIATLLPGAGSASTFGSTVSATLGSITRVVLATNKGLTTTTLGHLTVQSVWTTLFDLTSQLAGYTGEDAGTRIARLCAEEGINFARRLPVTAASTAMGPQPTDTLVNLIRGAVNADLGRLSEPRDQVGLAYRDRATLYDQTAQLALSYSAFNLAEALDPVDDDQFTRNDVTVTRTGGSSAEATKTTGTLSIGSIGRYDESVTLAVQTDTQLPDIAGWLLHLGTTDEARYPTIGLNLLHPTFTASDALTTAALVLDVGDRVTIDNPPAWLPPDQISLIVEGYTETIGGNGQHTMTLNCSPASPHTVAIYNDATYRYASDGSTLTSDVDATSVTLSVTTPTGPIWAVADGSFDITIGGERMTVTGISGTATPQTFTVTRSVNGIVKTHSAGDAVSLFKPAYYAI